MPSGVLGEQANGGIFLRRQASFSASAALWPGWADWEGSWVAGHANFCDVSVKCGATRIRLACFGDKFGLDLEHARLIALAQEVVSAR
jgi:hypothetical protein